MENQKKVIKKTFGMRKVYLKEGYVLIPENWIILDNFSTPSDCMYAGVVETREPLDRKKKYNAKHYVYFCDYKYGNEYPSNFDAAIYAACCEKDESFNEILNDVVIPAYTGNATVENMTNLAEYLAAPCPGLFHIVEQGDPMYWNMDPNYTAPYGAVIIR